MFCTNHSPALRQPSRTVLLFRQPISTVLYFIKPTKEMVSCTIFYANQLRFSVTQTNQHRCFVTPTNQHRCSVNANQSALLYYYANQPAPLFCYAKNQPCCTVTPTNEMPSCTIFCTNQHRCSVTPSNQMPSCNIFCTNQPWCSVTPTNEMPSCIIFCTNPPCCSVTPVALSFVRYILHQSAAELLYFAPISTVVLLRQPMRCRIAIFCTNLQMPFSLLTGRLLSRNRSTPRRRASCGSPSGMNYFYSSGHHGLSSSCLLYSKIIRIITYYHHVQ